MNICDKLSQQSYVLAKKLNSVNGLLELIEDFVSNVNFSADDDLPIDVYQYEGSIDELDSFLNGITNVDGSKAMVTLDGLVGYFKYEKEYLESSGDFRRVVYFVHGLAEKADKSNLYQVAMIQPNKRIYLSDIVINIQGDNYSYSFPDLLNNLVSNISDIELTQKITELASIGQLNLSSFTALVSANSIKTDFINEITTDLTNLLSQVNEDEVAVSIFTYLKNKLRGSDQQLSSDEVNARIEFSSAAPPIMRSTLIPWGQVVTSVGQIIGFAVSIFSPVAGLAIIGTCTVVKKVSELIQNATGDRYQLLTEGKARGNRYTNSPMFQTTLPLSRIADQEIRNALLNYGACKLENNLYTVYVWSNDSELSESSSILLEAFPSFYVSGNTSQASIEHCNNLLNRIFYSFTSDCGPSKSLWTTATTANTAFQDVTILHDVSQAVSIQDASIYDMSWFDKQPIERLSRMMTFFHAQWNLLLLSIIAKISGHQFPNNIEILNLANRRLTEREMEDNFGLQSANQLNSLCAALSCYLTLATSQQYGGEIKWFDEAYQPLVDNVNIININYVPQIIADFLKNATDVERSSFVSFFIHTVTGTSRPSPTASMLSTLTDDDYDMDSSVKEVLTPSVNLMDKGQARLLCPHKVFNIWLEIFAVAAALVTILLMKRSIKNKAIARRTRKQLKLEKDILDRRNALLQHGGTTSDYARLGRRTAKFNKLTKAICNTPSAPNPQPSENNLLNKVSMDDVLALIAFATTGDSSFIIDTASGQVSSDTVSQKLSVIKRLIKSDE